MDIDLGPEIALPLHLPVAATYTELEAALVNAGFTDYTINRSVNPDGSGDAQIYIRAGYDNGVPKVLDAADTITQLAAAFTALQGSQSRSNESESESA